MAKYNIDFRKGGNLLKVGFGEDSADGNWIVQEAAAKIDELIQGETIEGGDLIKINGPATLGVAMVLGHRLAHLFKTIAFYDPKMGKYIVAITHGGNYRVGDLLPE